MPAADLESEWSDLGVRDTVRLLVEDVDTVFALRNGERPHAAMARWQKSRVEFDARLDVIATRLRNEPNESARLLKLIESHPSLAGSLVKIALHRSQNRALYDQISEIHRKALGGHALRTGEPHADKCTEEYRLVWEYYLIVPKSDIFTGLVWQTALQALGRIKNRASIVVISSLCKALLHPRSLLRGRALERPIYALGEFKTTAALKAMVEYVLEAEKTTGPPPGRSSLRKSLQDVIAAGRSAKDKPSFVVPPPGKGEPSWSSIVQEYRNMRDCPEDHRKLLGEISKP